MSEDQAQVPYNNLRPELILEAAEAAGLGPTGSMLALNSYENRVYQLQLEDHSFVVIKFYRPGRWRDEAILEEHAFAEELAAQDIPVVVPMRITGKTLLEYGGYRYSIYPRRGGRWPELDQEDTLEELGRLIGRIHMVGRSGRFKYRQTITVASHGQAALDYILEQGFVTDEVKYNYQQAAQDLIDQIGTLFESIQPAMIRIYGDCHPGNILATPNGYHLVDLDDCCTGPAIQDLWMLLSGDRNEMAQQLGSVLDGYSMFSDFDHSEIGLIEALRGLRYIYYSGWLARRWHDPAFPLHFPWFNTPRYWEEQMVLIREQMELCHLPALKPA